MAKRKKHFNTAKVIQNAIERKKEGRNERSETWKKENKGKKKLAEREIQRNDGIQKWSKKLTLAGENK